MEHYWRADAGFKQVALETLHVGNYLRLAWLCWQHGGANNFKA
jgi:hypothetical protein